jgi:hypothetical protein
MLGYKEWDAMKRMLGIGFGLGASMLVSCGGDTDSGGAAGSGGTSGPKIDEIPGLEAQAYCDVMKTCMGGLLDIFLGGQDCKTKLLPGVEDKDFAGIKAAVDKGTVKYDGSKVDACIKAMKDLGCSLTTTRNTPPCNEVLVGTVDTGGACTVNAECKGDAYCKGDTCPGACTPREASGVPCRFDDACRTGMKCIYSVCGTPGGAGAECIEDGDDCDITMICVGADNEKNVKGKCTKITDVFKAKVGEACDLTKGQFCEAGLSCMLDSTTTFTFKCVDLLASGAACKVGAPDPCPLGEYCKGVDLNAKPPVFEGTCSKSPGDGEPCAQVFGATCATNAVCDENTICRVPQRIGGTCASDKACYSESCVGGICKAGDACTP